jgi:hypothetical protein
VQIIKVSSFIFFSIKIKVCAGKDFSFNFLQRAGLQIKLYEKNK